MPTTYSLADASDLKMLSAAMARWHQDLHDAEVRVGVLMARNPDGPAVKAGGYPALAMVKVVPLKDRVRKSIDAEITIDAHEWGKLTPAQQLAVFDHELAHLRLAKPMGRDDDDNIRFGRDDLGRPKLKLVPADWNVGDGFAEIVLRHGHAAAEWRNVNATHTRAVALIDQYLAETGRRIVRDYAAEPETLFTTTERNA